MGLEWVWVERAVVGSLEAGDDEAAEAVGKNVAGVVAEVAADVATEVEAEVAAEAVAQLGR